VRSTSSSRRQLLDTGNIFLALCVFFFAICLANTFGMEEASSYLLPRLVCAFGAAVGSARLIFTFWKGAPETESEEEGEARGLRVGYSILFVTIYFLATQWLGFILSTAIAMLAFSYLMSYPRKKLAVVLSIVIPLALHLAFVTLLQASLPAGLVENLLF